jgi:hypothetical protein
MQANPDNFQAVAVGNKTHAKTPVFKIDSAEIIVGRCSHPRYIYNIGISKIIFTIFKNN